VPKREMEIMETAVGLGSNQGDRVGNLRAAITLLEGLAADGRVEVSPFYETAPVNCPPGSADFLNAVVVFKTRERPEELLALMQRFEGDLGRPRERTRNAPRPLDMDLLYVGPLKIESPDLILPHPRLTSRRFVLQPLNDLRPDAILPGQVKTVNQLLAALPQEGIIRCAKSHH